MALIEYRIFLQKTTCAAIILQLLFMERISYKKISRPQVGFDMTVLGASFKVDVKVKNSIEDGSCFLIEGWSSVDEYKANGASFSK